MSNTSNVTFPEAIRIAVQNFIADVNVCLPGKIIKILDAKKRKISVQPEIKRVYLDNTELEPPIIENVPLKYTGSSESILHFPIKTGDKVIIIFSQRSLDNWLSDDKLTTPGKRRMFDITDAIAIPGIQSFKDDHPLIDNENDLVLRTTNHDLHIDTTAKKVVINNDVEDLATLMKDLLNEIIAIQTVGSPPQHVLSPTSITNFTAIKTRIALLLQEN